MKTGFVILPEKKLIMENISGLLKIKKIAEHRKFIYNHPDFNRKYNFLLDLRDAKIDISIEQFNNYIKYLSSEGVFEERKSALLVKNANQIAFSKAFKKFEDEIPFHTGIFTKIDDAIEWLGLIQDKDIVLTHNFRLKSEPDFLWQNDSDEISNY